MPSNDGVSALQNYQIVDEIGRGSYGVVKIAINKETGEKCCVKIFNKNTLSHDAYNRIFTEVDSMKSFQDHPNVIKIEKFVEDTVVLYIFMQFAEGGDLLREVMKIKKIPEVDARNICKQLIHVLQHIHQNGWIHRDIKLENILLSADKQHIYLGDWGFAGRWQPGIYQTSSNGSIHYSSPEIVFSKRILWT